MGHPADQAQDWAVAEPRHRRVGSHGAEVRHQEAARRRSGEHAHRQISRTAEV